MDGEIDLISDGDGLAVIGPRAAVESFLHSTGLWSASKQLDLRPLTRILGTAGELAETASTVAAESGRWLKLTPESAADHRTLGLMPTKVPGISHAMLGKPGEVQKWLQVEQDAGAFLTNPAVLGGAAGIMSQAAMKQAMAEIADYLKQIDEKVDDILKKLDGVVTSKMYGMAHAVDRAMDIREQTGMVNATLWSTIDQAHQVIGATQDYALDQLRTIAEKFETTKVGDLAKTAESAEVEVPRWLAVLARCIQVQDAVNVLELDRVIEEAPHQLADYRRGLTSNQAKRCLRIAEQTENLVDRMDTAVTTANAKLVWSRSKALQIVDSANDLSAFIDEVHGLLKIEAEPRSWEARQLSPVAQVSSQGIQMTKDEGLKVATGALVVTAVVARKKLGIKRP